MKRILAIAAVLLSGCDESGRISASDYAKEMQAIQAQNPQPFTSREYVRFWRDPETGCEYLRGDADKSMTPRLRPDGKPLCRKS